MARNMQDCWTQFMRIQAKHTYVGPILILVPTEHYAVGFVRCCKQDKDYRWSEQLRGGKRRVRFETGEDFVVASTWTDANSPMGFLDLLTTDIRRVYMLDSVGVRPAIKSNLRSVCQLRGIQFYILNL